MLEEEYLWFLSLIYKYGNRFIKKVLCMLSYMLLCILNCPFHLWNISLVERLANVLFCFLFAIRQGLKCSIYLILHTGMFLYKELSRCPFVLVFMYCICPFNI